MTAIDTHAFTSLEEAESFIKVFEATNCVSFTNIKSTKGFGTFDTKTIQVRKLFWLDNVPVLRVGTKMLQCRHKLVQHTRLSGNELALQEHTYGTKTAELEEKRQRYNRAEKCPAKLTIREVIEFRDYKAKKRTKEERSQISLKLKEDLVSDVSSVNAVKVFYCDIPRQEAHKGHSLGNVSFMHQNLENYLSSEIQRLAGEGITDPAEVKSRLMLSVSAMTVIPVDEKNGKVFSSSEEVYDKIQMAKRFKSGDSSELEEVVVIHV